MAGTPPTTIEAEFALPRYDQGYRIPLGDLRERIREKDTITFRLDDLGAWPNQQFEARFEFSNPTQRWIWTFIRRGTTIAAQAETDPVNEQLFHAPVEVNLPYRHRDLLLARFVAPGSRIERVDETNLGRTVHLEFYPGPASPDFPYDLD